MILSINPNKDYEFDKSLFYLSITIGNYGQTENTFGSDDRKYFL